MDKIVKVSKRIETIASMIDRNSVMADIGTDHGYLAIYAVQIGKATHCYASDINSSPLSVAAKNVEKYGLEEKISLKLADGISQLESDVDTITISGMGGSLMTSIFSSNKSKLKNVKTIICQPNVGAFTIRKWLVNNGFMIVDEKLFEEGNKYYEVIKAIKGEDYLTDKEILFGPCLLQEKSELFYKRWKDEFKFVSEIIKKVPKGTEDYSRLRNYRSQIEVVLKD